MHNHSGDLPLSYPHGYAAFMCKAQSITICYIWSLITGWFFFNLNWDLALSYFVYYQYWGNLRLQKNCNSSNQTVGKPIYTTVHYTYAHAMGNFYYRTSIVHNSHAELQRIFFSFCQNFKVLYFVAKTCLGV